MYSSRFRTPQDFLEHLRTLYAEPRVTDPDPIAYSILREQWKLEPHPRYRAPEEAGDYRAVVSDLLGDFRAALPRSISRRVARHVAIGALDIDTVNAMCVKSPDGKYAVLIHYGLMNFFHKYFKLSLASSCADHVVYCSRKEASSVTSDDLREYARELISNYRRHRSTRGAIVMLDERTPPEFYFTYGVALATCEAFALCHEMAHFLLGHLEDSDNLVPLPADSALKMFKEDRTQALEYDADHTGYELARRIVVERFPSAKEPMLLIPLILTFDLLHLITGGHSGSHPHTLARLSRLVGSFYGNQAARMLEKSYGDRRLLEELCEHVREPGN